MDWIYSFFSSFFGGELHDFLTGFDCDGNYISSNNQYNLFGLISVLIALLIVLLYYYGINHSRFNRWWSWLIMLIVSSTIDLFYGYEIAYSQLNRGLIPDCFLYDQEGNQLIFESNCWGLGAANFIVSMLFFIIFSFVFKWWSRNCKHSPCI